MRDGESNHTSPGHHHRASLPVLGSRWSPTPGVLALGPIYREVAEVHFSPQVRPHQNSTITTPSFSSEYHPILSTDQLSATFQKTHRAAPASPLQPQQTRHFQIGPGANSRACAPPLLLRLRTRRERRGLDTPLQLEPITVRGGGLTRLPRRRRAWELTR